MSETIAPTVIRRVERVDLDMLAPWLVGRIQQRHKEATSAQIRGWLYGLLASNEYWFQRTDRACALAQVVTFPLQSHPEAFEWFAFCMEEGDEHELADMYPHMAAWAERLGASKLWIGRWSDIATPRAAGRIGRKNQSANVQHYVSLGG